MFGLFLLVSLQIVVLTSGHSWIACTDYAEMNGLYYSTEKCRAWPRSGHLYTPHNQRFGYESGYAYVPQMDFPCRTRRHDICGYNSEYPMAKYYAGQTVVIAHPTKNHANDPRCNQANNQDNGNYVYAFKTTDSATADPKREEFMAPQNLIADLGISPVNGREGYTYEDFVTYPKIGFQNAPAYCEGTDGALATNNITIPSSWTPGRYSFMWIWYMGSPAITSAYSSCWEADVYATKEEADVARMSAATPARQDTAIRFNSNWGSGADGAIGMPADPEESFLVVKFPTKVASFSVWGAAVNSTEEMKNRGEYILYQKGTWWQPPEAGFTVSFSSESSMPCGVSENEIETRIVDYTPKVKRMFGSLYGPRANRRNHWPRY